MADLDPGQDERGKEIVEQSMSHGVPEDAPPAGTGGMPGSQGYRDRVSAGADKLAEKEAANRAAGRHPEAGISPMGKLSTSLGKAGGFMGKHKKKFAVGGGIAGALLAAVMSFISILPLKLEAYLKNMSEKRIERIAERAVETRLAQLMQRFAADTVAAGAAEGTAAGDAAFEKLTVATGQFERDVVRTWRLRKFATQLETEKGVRFQRGSKIGTVDVFKDGKLVGNMGSKDARKLVNAAVRDIAKPGQFLKRHHLRVWARNALGIQRWKFFKGETDPDKASTEVRGKLVENAGLESSEKLPKVVDDALEGESNANAEGSDSEVKQALTDAQKAGAEAVENAPKGLTAKAMQAIFGKAIATKIASVLTKAAGPLIIVTIVDIASRIDNWISSGKADAELVAYNQAQYMAQFINWETISDNQKDGTTADGKKVTGVEVNAVMMQLGDPAKSCAFQQIMMDRDPANCQKLTTTNDGSDHSIGRSTNTHATPIKTAYDSTFAATVYNPQGLVTHVVLVAWYNTGRHVMDLINGAIGAALSLIPGLESLMGAIGQWLTDLLKDMFFSAVSGLETDGDLFNNLDAGAAGVGQSVMHEWGGQEVTYSQSQSMMQQYAAERASEDNASLATRLFSPDYTDSAVNKLAAIMPTSLTEVGNSTLSYMASILANPVDWLRTSFAMIQVPGLQPAYAAGQPKDLYGYKHYDFLDADLEQDDTAALAAAAENTAKRTGKAVGDVKLDDAKIEDCPDTGSKPNVCRLDIVMMQSAYANFTTTDNGGIGGTSAAAAPIAANSLCSDAVSCAKAMVALKASGQITRYQQASDERDVNTIADGGKINFCQIHNGTLNVTLMQFIVKMATKYKIEINAIASGHYVQGKPGGCDGAFHDFGRAIDINDPGVTPAMVSDLATMLPDGGGVGQQQCSFTKGANVPEPRLRFFSDACNHLHLDVGGGAP